MKKRERRETKERQAGRLPHEKEKWQEKKERQE